MKWANRETLKNQGAWFLKNQGAGSFEIVGPQIFF
jgi:hypothetical protein